MACDVPPPLRIHEAFDDPAAVLRIVRRHGPYPSIARVLPASATRGDASQHAGDAVMPWFRATWASHGTPLVDGADVILGNEKFCRAAAELFDAASVVPNTVVVNVNAPMPPGAIHVDIPSFRGADRDRYPVRLLQAMGSSGLFEAWRVIEAGAVAWFYDGAGGAYEYWPQGLDGPKRSEQPPFSNVALVADNDRMFHRIGRIGHPTASVPPLSPDAQIHFSDGEWAITDGEATFRYRDDEVRVSILWKARIDVVDDQDSAPLSGAHILEIFSADLAARRVGMHIGDVLDDATIDTLHAAYYAPATTEP